MYIRVYGDPAPQGSKTARPVFAGTGEDRHPTGQINQVESSKRVKPWRQAVKEAALEQGRGRGFGPGVPVALILQFYVKRPAGHYGTGRNAGQLKPSAAAFPTGKKDDIDKLERAVLDALTEAGCWHDDGQVCSVMKARDYADNGQAPGCEIWISQRHPREASSDERA